MCLDLCGEDESVCAFFTLLGFFQRSVPKAVSREAPSSSSRSLVLFYSAVSISCILLRKERCENPVVFGVDWRFSWSKFLQVLESVLARSVLLLETKRGSELNS